MYLVCLFDGICKKGNCCVILVIQILTTDRLLRFEFLASLALALFIRFLFLVICYCTFYSTTLLVLASKFTAVSPCGSLPNS